MTITTEKLDEIERGLEGVTPGPWRGPFGKTPYVVRTKQDSYGSVQVAECGNYRDAEIRPFNIDRWLADTAHIARLDPTTVAELVRLARIGLAAEARPDIAAVLRGEGVVVPREASGKMWAAGRSALSSPAEMIRGADYEAASAHADRIPEKVWAAMIAAGEKEMGR